jgi:hypothetical protein
MDVIEPRKIWQAYRRMHRLLEGLPPHTTAVVRAVLEHGASEETIRLAQEAPEEEWQRYQLLRMLGNGNPAQLAALTGLALDEIRLGIVDGRLP